MSKKLELEEFFHAQGKRGYLHCRGDYCTFDVGVEQDSQPRYETADVEVLLQPRSTDGLPTGNPASLLRETVNLSGLPGDKFVWARLFLPTSLRSSVARECYYRVTPTRRAWQSEGQSRKASTEPAQGTNQRSEKR